MRRVPGEGPTPSNIMFIGEAPGAEEDALGRPFVGRSGRLFDAMLKGAGIIRDEVYITNLIKYRPLKNDFKRVTKEELKEARKELKKEILTVNPNIIVALGGHALLAVTGRGGIDNLAGSILPGTLVEGTKVIGIWHPAWLLRGKMKMRPLVESLLKRVKGQSHTTTIPHIVRNVVYEPQIGDLEDWLRGQGTLSFDIETRGNNLTCMGFARSKEEGIVIPLTKGIRNYWRVEEEVEIWRVVAGVLEDPEIEIICHNAFFECTMLGRVHGVLIHNVQDTMVLHNTLYPEMEKGLDDLVRLYTLRPYYKDIRGKHRTDKELWEYNAEDCLSTFECWETMGELL